MGLGICPSRERNRTVFLGSQCSHSDFIAGRGVQIWKHRAYCCTSWLRAHWWSCTRRFVAVSLRGVACRVARGTQCGGGFVSFKICTHLLLYSCVVHVRVWVFQKVGLCMVSSQRKSVANWQAICQSCTLSMSGCTSHRTISGAMYRPGLKDANKPRYRLLRRKLWSVRFFPLAVFPTISQTLATEALGISVEAPMGNARDAVEERRDSAQRRECQGPGRLDEGPWSWRRQTRRPWESIWGCSVTQEALANRSQIREEHAYCDFQGPLYLFDPCRLGLFLAYWCKRFEQIESSRGIRLPRWPKWEIASYLYGACRHVSEFLKLPSRTVYCLPSSGLSSSFACRWVQAQLGSSQSGQQEVVAVSSMARGAVRDVQSEDF